MWTLHSKMHATDLWSCSVRPLGWDPCLRWRQRSFWITKFILCLRIAGQNWSKNGKVALMPVWKDVTLNSTYPRRRSKLAARFWRHWMIWSDLTMVSCCWSGAMSYHGELLVIRSNETLLGYSNIPCFEYVLIFHSFEFTWRLKWN